MDYTNNFIFDLIIELSKNTNINEHGIIFVEGKKLFFRLIYSLKLVELEILKTYIKIHLITMFI